METVEKNIEAVQIYIENYLKNAFICVSLTKNISNIINEK